MMRECLSFRSYLLILLRLNSMRELKYQNVVLGFTKKDMSVCTVLKHRYDSAMVGKKYEFTCCSGELVLTEVGKKDEEEEERYK